MNLLDEFEANMVARNIEAQRDRRRAFLINAGMLTATVMAAVAAWFGAIHQSIQMPPATVLAKFYIGEKVYYENDNFRGSAPIKKIKVTADGKVYYVIDVGKGTEIDFRETQIYKCE